MRPILTILFCDDDNSFALNQIETLARKLWIRCGIDAATCSFSSISHLSLLKEMSTNPTQAGKWDVIFCDLGWGELNLEGIQILNDFKLNHPLAGTVLYTAQEKDEIIRQTLEWKLSFIDDVIQIKGLDYLDHMLEILLENFHKKRLTILSLLDKRETFAQLERFLQKKSKSHELLKELSHICETTVVDGYLFKQIFPECQQLLTLPDDAAEQKRKQIEALVEELESEDDLDSCKIQGSRYLSPELSQKLKDMMRQKLPLLQQDLHPYLISKTSESLSLQILFSREEIRVSVGKDPLTQRQERCQELLNNLKRFPRLEGHDLIPLNKASYIEFVKKRYGGFPQMAQARGLDLNNIYRANRRFKHAPFVVFKYETIQEILGLYDSHEREQRLGTLVASPKDVLAWESKALTLGRNVQ